MLTSGLVRRFLFVGYLLKPKLLVMDVKINQIRKVLFKITAIERPQLGSSSSPRNLLEILKAGVGCIVDPVY